MYAVMASMPCRAITPASSSSQRAKASAQLDLAPALVAARAPSASRMRSGSSWSVPSVGALRADVALAPDVVVVGADLGDAVALDVDLEAAHGLAERAGSVVDRRGRRHAAAVLTASAALSVAAAACPSLVRHSPSRNAARSAMSWSVSVMPFIAELRAPRSLTSSAPSPARSLASSLTGSCAPAE